MVLRFTISDAPRLKEAIQAVPLPESQSVTIMWSPDYFAVLSGLHHRLPPGENPATLLKLLPQSFLTYECTDQRFNAVVKFQELEYVFTSARNLDLIVFSRSLETFNGVNNLGVLNARFMRPIVTVPGEEGEPGEESSGFALKIYKVFTESEVKSADVSQNPSLNRLPPVATFLSPIFARVMSTLKRKGISAVAIEVHKEEAFFSEAAEGEQEQVGFKLSLTAENGLKWTRGDVGSSPVRFEFPLANLDVEPGSKLSTEVSLFKRSERMRLIWFKLNTDVTSLRGDLIHYLY